MSKYIDLNLFLNLEKEEHGHDLTHFAEKWNVTRGLVSRWRYGGKRIGRDLARNVFSTIQRRFPSWTVERYEKEWPQIHDRYLLRKRKIDAWEANATESDPPPCRNCGDEEYRHAGGKGVCHDCPLGCKSFERLRGRRVSTVEKLTA